MTDELPVTPPPPSPPWGDTIKQVVGLSIATLILILLIYFRAYIGPIALAFILAYLLHPLAAWLDRHTPLSWRAAVGLVYLALVLLLLGALAVSGLALVQQVQTLYQVVQQFFLTTVPAWLTQLSTQVYTVGPFVLDFTRFDLNALGQQLLGAVQPILGQVGGLVSNLAARAFQLLGWLAFVLLLSYFLLVESGQVSVSFFQLEIPEYGEDIRYLGLLLGHIWHAFLRGQLVIALAVFLLNWLGLTLWGVRNALLLALLSGLARFVPYLGPLLVYLTGGLMILFQVRHPGQMPAWEHGVLVIAYLMVMDQIFDNYIVPRVMGNVLGVHPAAVLVAALVLARLIGVLGLLLAAPTVASLRLLSHYVFAKLSDRNPWEGLTPRPLTVWPVPPFLRRLFRRRRARNLRR